MKNSKNSIDVKLDNNTEQTEYRVYKKRWLMLAIFILFTFTNSLQWGEYVIISDKVVNYYLIEDKQVDWTIQVYMVTYIILIFPALWLLDRAGIRFCLTLGCAGLAIGAWIKVYASLSRDRFNFVLLGQTTEAVFQVLVFGLSARVVAVWFGSNEISFACALAMLGDQMGSAVGFFLTSRVVKSSSPIKIGEDLTTLNLIIAGISTIIFISALLFFKECPKTAPSAAQKLQKKSETDNIVVGITTCFKSKSFIIMSVSYGINIAVFNTYITVFNSTFKTHFPSEQHHVGYIVSLVMLMGIVGSVLVGYILDRTHLYKSTTVTLYVFSFLTVLLSTYMLRSENLVLVYASNLLMGFCQLSYYSIAIQLAIEMTYPVSECFSSSVLLLTCHILGILFGQIYRIIYDSTGDISANLGLSFIVLIGALLTMMIPPKMKRYKTEQNDLHSNQADVV